MKTMTERECDEFADAVATDMVARDCPDFSVSDLYALRDQAKRLPEVEAAEKEQRKAANFWIKEHGRMEAQRDALARVIIKPSTAFLGQVLTLEAVAPAVTVRVLRQLEKEAQEILGADWKDPLTAAQQRVEELEGLKAELEWLWTRCGQIVFDLPFSSKERAGLKNHKNAPWNVYRKDLQNCPRPSPIDPPRQPLKEQS